MKMDNNPNITVSNQHETLLHGQEKNNPVEIKEKMKAMIRGGDLLVTNGSKLRLRK